jgi:hypothetical protein
MKAARATANAPFDNREDEPRLPDGVARAAGLPRINQLVPLALVTTFARPEIVEPLRDDSEGDDSVVYADEDVGI